MILSRDHKIFKDTKYVSINFVLKVWNDAETFNIFYIFQNEVITDYYI